MKMKKLLSVLAVVLMSITGMAQKNVVKLNVPQLATGGLVLQYERFLIPMVRAQVGVGMYGRNDINQFGLPTVEALGLQLGGTVFQGELRIYPNVLKKGPRGLYLAPYGKIGTYNMTIQQTVSTTLQNVDIAGAPTDVDVDLEFNMDGKLGVKAYGLQLGYQFLFLKKLAINWYMLGPGVSFFHIHDVQGSIGYTAAGTIQVKDIIQDQAAQDQALQSYIETLGNLPLVGGMIEKKINNANIPAPVAVGNTSIFGIESMNLNYIPRLRMGLSVGFAF